MHLKRFRRGAKIDRHVAFPFALDVAPYASSAAERARLAFGDRSRRRVEGEKRLNDSHVDDEKNCVSDPPNPRSAYALFAVVVHSGGMESGHYICYVKCQDAWFRCDDHRVSRATRWWSPPRRRTCSSTTPSSSETRASGTRGEALYRYVSSRKVYL